MIYPPNNIKCLSFIGTAGIPNRYGGFESFLENCSPCFLDYFNKVIVTAYSALYPNRPRSYFGVDLKYINIPPNGGLSIIHDLLAFFVVFRMSTHIVVLGVSGGAWFPLFRVLCDFFGKKLIVNVDGVEWRRTKHSSFHRCILKYFDYLAQLFSHLVVYDNPALWSSLFKVSRNKSCMIPYSGDHVIVDKGLNLSPGTALTICRIEPENNIDLLIGGFLMSRSLRYTIVGNWTNSSYGIALKNKFSSNPRLELLDPIYDRYELAKLRQRCHFYLHGHSVGGTNPSLVEMLYYNCNIFCFDVPYNRETAGNAAYYFSSNLELSILLNSSDTRSDDRLKIRSKYTSKKIVSQYVRALEQMG